MDLENWFFWAEQHPGFRPPPDARDGKQRPLFLIRLLTRVVFCWFLQERSLIPRELFRRRNADEILRDCSPGAGTYYRAVLPKLFFAVLSVPRDERKFISRSFRGRNRDHGSQHVLRYEGDLKSTESLEAHLDQVPFLNGGLFDCLDRVPTAQQAGPELRRDGFSSRAEKQAQIPNELFFATDEDRIFVNLNKTYDDDRHERVAVRGLLEILPRYKFTIEENTPSEQEIALDPELLGKVFENLLAAFNEETRGQARKATGSFYTPREIVAYMVDEALLLHFERALASVSPRESSATTLRALFDAEAVGYDAHSFFSEAEIAALVTAIDSAKILDPACGSGAFPMGVLQRLVDLLAKLDPHNVAWKARQLDAVRADRAHAEQMHDTEVRGRALDAGAEREEEIVRSFDNPRHELDYARKLFLIENCIHGVDIQPIAVQIAKLRFFIATGSRRSTANSPTGERSLFAGLFEITSIFVR